MGLTNNIYGGDFYQWSPEYKIIKEIKDCIRLSLKNQYCVELKNIYKNNNLISISNKHSMSPKNVWYVVDTNNIIYEVYIEGIYSLKYDMDKDTINKYFIAAPFTFGVSLILLKNRLDKKEVKWENIYINKWWKKFDFPIDLDIYCLKKYRINEYMDYYMYRNIFCNRIIDDKEFVGYFGYYQITKFNNIKNKCFIKGYRYFNEKSKLKDSNGFITKEISNINNYKFKEYFDIEISLYWDRNKKQYYFNKIINIKIQNDNIVNTLQIDFINMNNKINNIDEKIDILINNKKNKNIKVIDLSLLNDNKCL